MHNNFVVRVILVFHCLVAGAFAQEATWNDYLFEHKSCDRVRTTITCSLSVTNQGPDRKMEFYTSNTRMFDNLGNEIIASDFNFTSNGNNEKQLISGIPVDAEIVFDGVSAQTTNITLLKVAIWSSGVVEFRNLTFTESQPQPQQKTVWNSYLFELRGCDKTNSTISCLFTVTNQIQDREIEFYTSNTTVFDNLGNGTRASEFKFTSNGSNEKKLISGIPVEAKVVFDGVSSAASNISVFEVSIWSSGRFKFRHIPFSNPQPLTDYDIGKEAGKQECLANPASCDIVSSDGKNASFDPNKGKLYLPFVNVPDTSGKVTVYQVELNQQAPYFVFELDVESIQQVSEEDK